MSGVSINPGAGRGKPGRPARPLLDRFFDNVVIDADGCCLWTGFTDAEGYGAIGAGGRDCRSLRVHRVSYELFVAPLASGLVIDHLCGVRNCVNPAHLEAVTPEENVRRSNALRPLPTHCKYGHPFDRANTYSFIGRNGRQHRKCRACAARRERERRAA